MGKRWHVRVLLSPFQSMPDPPVVASSLGAIKVALSYQRPSSFLSLLPLKQLMLRKLYYSSVNQALTTNIWRYREVSVQWAMLHLRTTVPIRPLKHRARSHQPQKP
jgi:hypothetical protein